MDFLRNKALLLSHCIIFIGLSFLAITYPSVGGEGDTIMHYFWANFALNNPQGLFNLWAKPFFTAFAAPATYFGFAGIKVFNIFCGIAASYTASLVAKGFGWKQYWLLPFIAFGSRSFIPYLFSGLTEPFAAFILILAIRFLQLAKEKANYYYWAFLLLSFLPYCRSEAKILLPIFALYGISQREYKSTAFLLIGTIFYSISGAFFHQGNLFWLFKSPYKSGASVYGQGSWLHYFERLEEMMGWVNYYLLLIAFVFASVNQILKRQLLSRATILIYLPALLFFGAHSTVWALGIFASAGLERVLILTFPLYWLIIVHFLSVITKNFGKYQMPIGLAFAFLISFSSFSLKTNFYWENALYLRPKQIFEKEEIAMFLQSRYPDLEQRKIVMDLPFLALSLNRNTLNTNDILNWERVTKELWEQLSPNALYIWDSKNVPFYFQLEKDDLMAIPWLKLVKSFNYEDTEYLIFESNEHYPGTKN